MPLIESGTQEARQENIKREIDAGRPPKQAEAIGYSTQRRFEGHTRVGVKRHTGHEIGVKKKE